MAPVAIQLLVPVVLGLLIGGVLAYQAGSTNDLVHPVPLGAVPSPTPSWVKPGASTPTPASLPSPGPITTTSGNCGVIVPANPLSAQGLVTLYQLTGGITPAESGCT